MILETLEVIDFRNLGESLSFGHGSNILAGWNGEGKTNFLEAISILATTRSFRTARASDAIAFGRESAIIRGRVARSAEMHRELQALITNTTKTFFVNGKREPAQRYLSQLHTVVFNADEMEVIRGTPDVRRRFLDHAITAIHPPYIQVIADLGRVLKQKNSLLSKLRDDGADLSKAADLLEPWNQQIVEHGSRVHRSRQRYVDRLNEVLEKRLFGREDVAIRYASSLEGKGDLDHYAELLAERLKLRVQAEIVSGHSLIGPHRDDLEIMLDGHDIRKFGSSGQQRSVLLLLQLANIAVYHARQNEYPLFLLDDIDSELDHRRIGLLLEFLAGKTQVFMTTSKESFVSELGSGAAVFDVSGGRAKRR